MSHNHLSGKFALPGRVPRFMRGRRLLMGALLAGMTGCASIPAPPAVPATLQPAGTPPTEADSVDGVVEELLATMSLEDKVGQLFVVFFEGPELSPALREMIETYRVGGIVLFASTGNVVSPTQLATLTNAAQTAARDSGGVPLLVAVDQEGGTVARLREGFTALPGNMALGATGDPARAREAGLITARELKAVGINMNLAPVLDVNSNPANPVIGLRSFGSSADLVSSLGLEVIRAHRDEGIIATAKHFPGHGDTAVDSHYGLPVVEHDRAHLDAVELTPFRAAIAEGVGAIMTAHVELPAVEPEEGVPATLSPAVLQGLLRKDLGFQGAILTDSLGMGALMERYTVSEAALAAFHAGVDVLAFGADAGHSPGEQKEVHAALLEGLRSGVIATERLDESVRRILRLKAEYGLLDWMPVDVEGVSARVGTAEHRALAASIAEEAITLVRDDSGIAPLPTEGALLVVAVEAGAGLIDAIREHRPQAQGLTVATEPTAEEVSAAVAAAAGAAAVVVVTRDAWRYPGQVELVRALAGHPLAVVAVGTPYDLLSFPEVPTYVTSYGAGDDALRAAARVLCGVVPPRGRLPVELPGLYPLGHGLTE